MAVAMASIRLAYLGGGSTRAAGTMAAFIHNHGASFAGSEVVLIDLDARPAGDRASGWRERMAAARGLDLRFRSTTDRLDGLTDVDAVLSSYRPGGFEARVLDERIPLQARGHRPGDAGAGRLLHGAALDPRAQGRDRGPRARSRRARGSSTTRTR